MKRNTLTLLSLISTLAAGCNEHPLKEVEYQWHQQCGGAVAVAPERPNVMLVLDRSGSMTSEQWDHDGDAASPEQTRWASLHEVTVDLLDRYEDRMRFGAVLYPSADADDQEGVSACRTADGPDVEVSARGAAEIRETLPPADATTMGGTPTQAALLNAIDHFAELDSTEPSVIVLVTDGAANCVDGTWEPGEYDTEVEAVVGEARKDGVSTYLVGIGITEEHDVPGRNLVDDMNAIASAGGVAREGEEAFYNVFDQDELNAALAAIAEEVVCTVEIGAGPEDREASMFVSVGQYSPRRIGSCEDGDGWYFTDATSNRIRLCGLACEQFLDHGRLSTAYDCSPEI